MTPDELISARAETHGDFRAVAQVAQTIRYAIREAPGWAAMSVMQREIADSIAVKLARFVCGDPNFPDHLRDIAGYAGLDR